MKKSTLESWIIETTGCETPGALARWQMKKLQEAATRAKSLSRFYQALYQDIDVGSLRNKEDISALPFTSATALAKNPNSWSCLSAGAVARIVTLKTSGTTQQPKRIFFSEKDQQLTIDFFANGMSGITDPPDRTMICLPCGQSGSVGDLLERGLAAAGVESVPLGPVKNIAESYRLLSDSGCKCIVGIPVQLLALARYGASLAPHNRVHLNAVLISADITPISLIKEIGRLFECEVFTHFGMTEMGFGGAVECSAHSGCHIRENDLLIEIIDPASGKPLPDGKRGEIVFTTLTREAMPFIRYRTGDWGILLSDRCRCGSWVRRLVPAGGRIKEDVLLPESSQPISLLWCLDHLLLDCEGVVDLSAAYDDHHLHITLHGLAKPDIKEAEKRLYKSKEFGALLKVGKLTAAIDFEQIVGFHSNGMQKRFVVLP